MRLSRSLRRLAPAALLFVLAACTERANPLHPAPVTPEGPRAVPITLALLSCTADVRAGTIDCSPDAPREGGPPGEVPSGTQHVTLTSGNAAYNGGTQEYTFDMTVRSLVQQPIGTADGSTLDASGVRVFLVSGPTVTSGSGSISVAADGLATFTAPNQPYYQYNQVLAQNAASSTRTWTLAMPATVTGFTFTLAVSAAVPHPDGYVALDGRLPGASYGSLAPGVSHPLAAVVKTALGDPVAGATVTYATSDPNCVTVDGSGLVSGVRFATCTVTATSGTRSGSMTFLVLGTTRNWTGAVSTDWSIGGNWAGGVAPAALDSVSIPTGVPNYPMLFANASIGGVTVADGATLNLLAFDLTVSANAQTGPTAGSGVVATSGRIILTGVAKTFAGRFPSTRVTGTYSLTGTYWGKAPEVVDQGRITISGFEMVITSF